MYITEMDITKKLLESVVLDLTIKAAGFDSITNDMYNAAAVAQTKATPEFADALYAAANELHKATEAITNAVSILNTELERVY